MSTPNLVPLENPPRCSAIVRRSGQACNNRPVAGEYCAAHDPTKAEERRENMLRMHALSLVAVKRAKELKARPHALENADDIRRVLEKAVGIVMASKAEPTARANALVKITQAATALYEVEKVGKKLAELKAQLDAEATEATVDPEGE